MNQMKTTFVMLALLSSVTAHAGGAGTVNTVCESADQSQRLSFEQNIAWFRTGDKIETTFSVTGAGGARLVGNDVAVITENSAKVFAVDSKRVQASIEFATGDFGPAKVRAVMDQQAVAFEGICEVR